MSPTRHKAGRELLLIVVDHDQQLYNTVNQPLSAADCGVIHQSIEIPPWRIRELRPDLLILNLSSCTRQKRSPQQYFELGAPVIVVSEEQALEFDLPDVLDFLTQPIDPRRLFEDVERVRSRMLLGRHHAFPPLNQADLSLFREFLHTYSGLNFDERNSKILERSLWRRMRAVAASDYLDYFDYLVAHRETRHEMKRFLSLLTVGETFFFRYAAHFDALAEKVIPEVIERNRRTRSLRIWSAGCSTGEEPYSLVIMLLDRFPQLFDWNVELLATDVNKISLAKAQQGIYSARSVRLVEPRLLQQWFTPAGESFKLDPRICQRVRFSYLNLQSGPYPGEEGGGDGGMDIILCRNVMIYFRLDTTRAVVARFSRALRPQGYFFMGHAETLLNISTDYDRHHYKGGFYYQLKKAEVAVIRPTVPAVLPAVPVRPAIESPPEQVPPVRGLSTADPPEVQDLPVVIDLERLCWEAEDAFRQENYRTAYQKYVTILEVDPERSCALVGMGFIRANDGAYREAMNFCQRALQQNDLCVSAYFLRGLLHNQLGDPVAAMNDYRKVLLLDLAFIMAHYHLGELCRSSGKQADARRQFKNVIRLAEREVPEAIIPYSGGLSATALLERCRFDLARLEPDRPATK